MTEQYKLTKLHVLIQDCFILLPSERKKNHIDESEIIHAHSFIIAVCIQL